MEIDKSVKVYFQYMSQSKDVYLSYKKANPNLCEEDKKI